MKRLALLFALALLPCGFCFAQNGSQPAATRQVSYGDCSFNLANVRGNVKISFSGPACNVFSASMEELLRQMLPLLQSELDYQRSASFYPSLAGLGCGSVTTLTAPINADAVTLPQSQTPFGWANASAPLELTTSPDVSKISTIDDSADIINFESVSKEFSAIPIKPAVAIITDADYLSPLSGLNSGTVDTGAQVPSGLIPDGAVVTWSSSLSFKSIADLTSDVADAGVQLPAGLTLSGASTNDAPFDSVSLTLSSSLVATGADYLSPSETLSGLGPGIADIQHPTFILADTSTNGAAFDLASSSSSLNSLLGPTSGVAGIGVQLPVGLVPPSASTDGTVFNSLAITSAPVDSSITIAGTDYASLAKGLSDIASSGHIITGWTVTYLTTEPH
ncbi:MAG: hypothetical protein WA581_05985 [Candidatus Acidiferrales bacterium]